MEGDAENPDGEMGWMGAKKAMASKNSTGLVCVFEEFNRIMRQKGWNVPLDVTKMCILMF